MNKEIQPAQPVGRVWEVDALRGFLILFVVWDHFMLDLTMFRTSFVSDFGKALSDFALKQYFSDTAVLGSLRNITHDSFVYAFVFISGMSCCFSRNNFKRALRLIAFSLALTLVTWIAQRAGYGGIMISFNVLHVLALSVLIWAGIEKLLPLMKRDWQKNLYGVTVSAIMVAMLVVGHYFIVNPCETKHFWAFLVQHSTNVIANFSPGDFLAFFPAFAYFLGGVYLGRFLYRERKTLFPSVSERAVAPLTFLGKKSIWVYFASQVIVILVLYTLSGSVLGWL